MSVPYTSLDVLKYMTLRVRRTIDWTTESLCAADDVAEDEIDALNELANEFDALLGPLREVWNHYSDGRQIKTRIEIEDGHIFDQVWHPDPSKDSEQSFSGRLIADPGENNGTFVVHIVPPQEVTVHRFPPLKSV
jgi:hypothetical protein